MRPTHPRSSGISVGRNMQSLIVGQAYGEARFNTGGIWIRRRPGATVWDLERPMRLGRRPEVVGLDGAIGG
jgi:hypothetical protein